MLSSLWGLIGQGGAVLLCAKYLLVVRSVG